MKLIANMFCRKRIKTQKKIKRWFWKIFRKRATQIIEG